MAENKGEKQKKAMSWKAREYTHFHKDLLWYAIVGLVTLILVVVGLWWDNFTFSIFMLLAGTLVIFWGHKEPEEVHFRIDNTAVYIEDDIVLDYKNLEGFDVHNHTHKSNEIVIKKSSHFNPFVKIPAPGDTIEDAERILSKHLPREKYEDSILDNAADWMRF